VTTAEIGRTVVVGLRLHNGGPNALRHVRVRAGLPDRPDTAIAIAGVVSASNILHHDEAPATTTIRLAKNRVGCATYVHGSTVLRNAHGGILRRSPMASPRAESTLVALTWALTRGAAWMFACDLSLTHRLTAATGSRHVGVALRSISAQCECRCGCTVCRVRSALSALIKGRLAAGTFLPRHQEP
jgi:hypothetical protein